MDLKGLIDSCSRVLVSFKLYRRTSASREYVRPEINCRRIYLTVHGSANDKLAVDSVVLLVCGLCLIPQREGNSLWLWASNSHTRPMSWRFTDRFIFRHILGHFFPRKWNLHHVYERVRSIRYQKGKLNVIKRQKISFLGLYVLLTDLWNLKDIQNSPKPF